MKTHIIYIILLVIIASIGAWFYNRYTYLQEDYKVSINNIKAYDSQLGDLNNKNIAFKFTIDQLHYYNDSILTKIKQVTKELKIKDKDLKQAQYIQSIANRVDTINYRDTIFVKSFMAIDTIIGDDWYKAKVGLRYPNKIIINPSFISEKYIITHSKKETIDPPKKCFILRWFQKKHTIIEVEVIEKNPFIINKQQKFIEIIK